MTKFIVIKKRQIIKYFFIILILSLLFYIFILSPIRTRPTFLDTTFFSKNQIEEDFTGDGILDYIDIQEKGDKYIINIKNSDNIYTLKSKEYNENFLDPSPSQNIQVRSIDLSRDGIPEIIISGIKNNTTSTYVFKWIKDDFYEIFYSNKNIYGILDSKNSRTPKFLHTLSSKGDTETEGYVFIGNTLKDISYSSPKIMSLSVIQKFIDLIELPYEISDAPDLFSPSIPSTELSLLWNLDKETQNYSFQNGYFYDTSWDDKGQPTSLFWTLSFNKYDTSNSKNTEFIIYVTVQINQFGEYKVSSITK